MSYLTFIQEVHKSLQDHGFDPIIWEIRSLAIVTSTNDYVERMFKLGAEQVIVLSKVQEKGRGRNKKVWESPEGGMWLSLGLKNDFGVTELSTPVVEAVCEVLSKYADCTVKPPNDVFISDRKVSGILVETKMSRDRMSRIIIGIGINVTNELPNSIETIATRLSDHCTPITIETLATEITIAVVKMLKELAFVNN